MFSFNKFIKVIKRYKSSENLIKLEKKNRQTSNREALRRYNVENNHLFGKLLETQKDRRERLTGVKESVSKIDEFIKKDDYANEESKHFDTIKIVDTKGSADNVVNQVSKHDVVISCTKTPEIKISDSIIQKENEDSKVVSEEISIKLQPLFNASKKDLSEYDTPGICPSTNNVSSAGYPSVTRILGETLSDSAKFLLNRWKANMIAQLGEEGFMEFNKNQLNLGKSMHELIRKHLMGCSESELLVKPELNGCWRSLQSVFPLITNVKTLEGNVVHQTLKYKGILDCIAYFRGRPVIIDWKKADKAKPTISSTYDAPLQLVAYTGAVNFDDSYPFKVQEAVVVVAYSDGSRADVYYLNKNDCENYWGKWLLRLDKYHKLHNDLNEASKNNEPVEAKL